MTPTYDTLIIGAGIAGASLGYRLAVAGQQRVLLLERESQPGYHSTGRSAAMFMEAYGTPQIQALTRASRAFYEAPPQGFCEHPLLEPRGCLYVAGLEQRELLEQTYAQNLANGTEVSLLDRDAALAQVPSLRGEALAGAVLEPGAMDLDVHALHQGFLRGYRTAGGELRCNAELIQARYLDGVWQVELADGSRLQARRLVNAAGAWADRVAEQCGVARIGLQPCRRSAFTFPGPAEQDFTGWPAVIGVDESFYFKPDAGQLLGSPANADPVEPQDAAPEELDVAMGIYNIEAMTTLAIRRPSHTWAGLRSFVADGDLVIGFDAHVPAFFWLAAQGGYGIQSAAGASRLAADLLLGQPLCPDLVSQGVAPERLSPARFQQP
ncbi:MULTISPECIES: FAD-dependent oxidoreductase [unclassified Pseudomonas]|uniref:NAD(P)/FAD-dependent oxidoreductase n=1 Tax=unclassified Pseudomonas TaxID=196821 RepID=UPI001AE15E3B|nr:MULTISPECIES: FAD-dependent oxidoreductase [unclassified Pseudomonas]MBP2270585.1 D-arginine dehydrogenase [Pseudomonas sp. BP6]MBP2285132.1 D-arginine dehydrogenase [Pseudomonas sp. BP7]HDS1696379.1 FAD-binding oxidoreductase [Pseudomonas putida]HDS1701370.1 FAD-binding oxidoreductase [Pseudomonas putida]